EGAHDIVETAHDADKLGMTWGNASHAFGEEAAELLEGTASPGRLAMAGLAPAFSALGIFGGTKEIIEGLDDGGRRGAVSVMSGGSSVISSGADLAALAGVGGAAPVALLASAGRLGVEAGDLFNSSLKEEGWFQDDAGNAESASEMAA